MQVDDVHLMTASRQEEASTTNDVSSIVLFQLVLFRLVFVHCMSCLVLSCLVLSLEVED